MSKAIKFIVGAAAAAFTGGASLFAGLSWAALGQAAAYTLASTALSAITSAFMPKPKAPSFDNLLNGGQSQQIRQPIVPWRVVYGATRVSGPIVFVASSSSNKYLHMLIVLAAHEVDDIGTVYLNDEAVYSHQLNGSGLVTSGKYANKVRIKKYLGTAAQSADSDLMAEVPEWTSNHRIRGRAYVYVRYEYDANLFATGIPNLSAEVRGRKVYDPRTGLTQWSNNPALVLLDYLKNQDFGLRVADSEIDNLHFIAAANISDEMVNTLAVSHAVTSVDTARNTLKLDNTTCQYQVGDRVQLTTTDTVPGGLATATNYYVIVTQHRGTPEISLATTYANALANIAIDLTSAGTGTITVTKNAEPRYTASGAFDVDRAPNEILQDLVRSIGGRVVYVGGKWRLIAGAWPGVSLSLDKSHMVSAMQIQTKHSRSERFNGVKGVYTSPLNGWQPSDYPPVLSSAFKADDNAEPIYLDYDLPFTSRPQTAQRLAHLELQRHRRELTVTCIFNLTGMKVQCGDIIALDDEVMGWAGKTFEIVGWELKPQDSNGVPAYVVEMQLREIDATAFAWDHTLQEAAVLPMPSTSLLNPLSLAPMSNLTLESGTDALFVKSDGTVISRIKATWDASPDGLVDRYELQYKKSSVADWNPSFSVSSDLSTTFIHEVEDGVSYDVRARVVNRIGVSSEWLTVNGHVVVGKTQPPANVAQFSGSQNGNVVTFDWSQVNDRDLAGYEIRFGPAGVDWSNATPLTSVTRGTRITTASVPPGDWLFLIKARDTSFNYSLTATGFSLLVDNTNDVIATNPQSPYFLGTPENMFRYCLRDILVPKSQGVAADDGWDTFDQYVPNCYPSYGYTSTEFDQGFDAKVRTWASFSATLGPGETGAAAPRFQLAVKPDGGSYGSFTDWTVGNSDGRFFKHKLTFESASGVAYLQDFVPTVDAVEATQGENDTVIAPGGTTINFSPRYHLAPRVTVTALAVSGAVRIASIVSVNSTSFTCRVYDASGTDVGGVVNWDAKGV